MIDQIKWIDMTIDNTELQHLRRCVELASEALEAGNEPFGSGLVGTELFWRRSVIRWGRAMLLNIQSLRWPAGPLII